MTDSTRLAEALRELRRAWWACVHNCMAHPLLSLSGNSGWSVAFHDWTATKWLGEQQ